MKNPAQLQGPVLRPHSFVFSTMETKCRWCGATQESVEDNVVPVECASHHPVERMFEETCTSLRHRIMHLHNRANALTSEALNERALAKVLEGHLAEIANAAPKPDTPR